MRHPTETYFNEKMDDILAKAPPTVRAMLGTMEPILRPLMYQAFLFGMTHAGSMIVDAIPPVEIES